MSKKTSTDKFSRSSVDEAIEDYCDAKASLQDESPLHFMYVVECADGTFYTGYARDVDQRVETHNSGNGAKYTRSRRPVRLVASAAFETKHEAMSAEYRFKRLSRSAKLEMLSCEDGFQDRIVKAFFSDE